MQSVYIRTGYRHTHREKSKNTKPLNLGRQIKLVVTQGNATKQIDIKFNNISNYRKLVKFIEDKITELTNITKNIRINTNKIYELNNSLNVYKQIFDALTNLNNTNLLEIKINQLYFSDLIEYIEELKQNDPEKYRSSVRSSNKSSTLRSNMKLPLNLTMEDKPGAYLCVKDKQDNLTCKENITLNKSNETQQKIKGLINTINTKRSSTSTKSKNNKFKKATKKSRLERLYYYTNPTTNGEPKTFNVVENDYKDLIALFKQKNSTDV